jgi:PAS domain S-box-containing protein
MTNRQSARRATKPRSRPDEQPLPLELLVDELDDTALFVLDATGQVTSWNAGAERLLGYAADELGAFHGLFTDEDRAAGVPDQLLQPSVGDRRSQHDGWAVRRDGSRFRARLVVTRVREGFGVIARDLTAQVAAAELQRSRDQLDLILRSINEGVMVQTAGGSLQFANDAAARLCGFASSAEMMATPRDRILERFEVRREDGTPLPPAELPARQALQGKATRAILRFRTRSPHGADERWSMVSAAPVFGPAGEVQLAVSVFRELTAAKRAEQSWQYLAEASAALGSSLDTETTLARVARLAVPAIADWSSVELLDGAGRLQQLAVAHIDEAKVALARQWRQRWPPGPGSPSLRVLATGVPELLPEVTDEMLEALPLDPEQRRLARTLGLRSAMVVPLASGRQRPPLGVMNFVSAESGRRYGPDDLIMAAEIGRRAALAVDNARAYEEVRAAVEVRDTFLSVASHELRTPLSALTLILSSLVRIAREDRLDEVGPDALRERLLRAERQAQQLAALIERLLDVGNLAAGGPRLALDDVDLGEVAAEVLARFQESSPGASLTLERRGPARGCWDRGRLDQVVSNLVSNALKYGEGAAVTVVVGPGAPGEARLTVQDRGPGVAPGERERIFEQFARAAVPSVPGMGLGLWIVRRIVAAHGGSVTLDDAGPGASFTVRLPERPPAA